uniref:transporter n=1 Tax=Thaumasiovibrio occultus TaxID=1891184 RepID=UPI000B35780E|nr:transporter [Thaumasiovibrio occultus]
MNTKRLVVGAMVLSLALPLQAEEEQPQQRVQTVADVLEQPGVLTPRGMFVLDTAFSYAQNSSNRVSVVGYTVLPTLIVGRIEVSDADRTTVTVGLTGRYGITNRLEMEVRVPWVYRNDSIAVRPIQDGAPTTEITDLKGSDLGDVELALRYQFNMQEPPYWVGGVRVKSNTGTSPYDIEVDPDTNEATDVPSGSGFWSVEPNISMIYPTDPAVIYLNFGYLYNIEDNVTVGDNSVDIRLGDTISLSAGMGFSVNQDFSFSLGLSHKTILKSHVDGETQNGAKLLQLDTINFGANYRINPRTSLNISAQAGLTDDAPDFQLGIRVPFSFQ